MAFRNQRTVSNDRRKKGERNNNIELSNYVPNYKSRQKNYLDRRTLQRRNTSVAVADNRRSESDRRTSDERRQTERIQNSLPVTIFPIAKELNENISEVTPTITGEINNISETGVKALIDDFSSLEAQLYVNLPPCYSEDPMKAPGIKIRVKQIWSRPVATIGKRLYGLLFLDPEEKEIAILRNIIKYNTEKSKKKASFTPRPTIDIHREPHSCNMYAVDLTIGCESGCKYCHFSELYRDEYQDKYPSYKNFPMPVDISPIYTMKEFPQTVVYLSPSSDPFGPQAKDLTHELLAYLLPKGVKFAISTKNLIPKKIIPLFKKYLSQIEIEIGITNLSRKRNTLLEKGCPPVEERLENLHHLVEMGCNPGVRMDPLFPVIDDNITFLESTIKAIAKTGAKYITAAYIFTFGKFFERLKAEPFLKESLEHLTEKCYVTGGKAISAPLKKKKQTFEKMNKICVSYDIKFSVCGCKDIRLGETTNYPLVCRRTIH